MARLTNTVASSQLTISVTYNAMNPNNAESMLFSRSDAIQTTNNTNYVTLLALPSVNWVNTIEFIKIYNPDTQANTVQFFAWYTPIYSCTVEPEETIMISEAGLKNIFS